MSEIYDEIAEVGYIGSILLNPTVFRAYPLNPDDFYKLPNSQIVQAIKNLSEQDSSIDYMTVCSELKRIKSDVTPIELSDILTRTETSMGAKNHAETIKNYHAKRMMKITFLNGATMCENGKDPSDIMASVTNQLGRVQITSKADDHVYDMKTANKNAVEATLNASKGERALLTGLAGLDDIIRIKKGELITIAAPTSQGKTALLATIVLNSARMGKKWIVFTLEGGHVPFVHRLQSQISGIAAEDIMEGKIPETKLTEYYQAIEEVDGLSITIVDIPSIKISNIKRLVRKGKYNACAVDYIQLAHSDTKNERRDLDIGAVTSGLKDLAMENPDPEENLVVVELAQIDRNLEKQTDRKPKLSHLRESASIENDSDTVIFIYRPDLINMNLVHFLVPKHRNGRTGEAYGIFKPYTMSFESATGTNYDPNK